MHQDLGRHDVAVHQREGVVGEARVDAGDEAARQRPSRTPARRRAAAQRATRRRGRTRRAARTRAATAPSRASRRRSAARGPGARSAGTATRADRRPGRSCTMYQPSAPCSPPSTKMRDEPGASRAECARRASEPQERQQEDDADQRGRAAGATYSHQKMPLNSSSVMPWLTCGTRASPGTWRRPPAIRRVDQRRHRADDRLPFGDRQARVREARDAADDDHQRTPARNRREATRRQHEDAPAMRGRSRRDRRAGSPRHRCGWARACPRRNSRADFNAVGRGARAAAYCGSRRSLCTRMPMTAQRS